MIKRNNKRIRTLLFEILGFTLLLLVSSVAVKRTLQYLVRRSDNAQTGKVNLIMRHKIDDDIVIFGSSVAEVGFNANLISKDINKSVYNAALDGTRVRQNKVLIDEFNNYSKARQTVIIGLSFFSLSEENKLTSPTRFYAYFDNPGVSHMFETSDASTYKKLKYIPFYEFSQYTHTYYKNAAIGMKNIFKGKRLEKDLNNGFVPHDSKWYGEEIREEQFGTMQIGFSDRTISELEGVIINLKDSGKKVILVVCPMYLSGQKFYANYPALVDKIKSFESLGAEVFDFTKLPLNSNKDYFYNNGHLNTKGAEIFSHIVADSLNTIK